MEETAWSLIKATIVGVFSAIAAYFVPIGPFVLVIISAFILNFLAGISAGFLVLDESFDFKKAIWTFIEMDTYLIIVASAFFIGDKMNDREAVLKGIYGVTYAFIYFYSINILRNLKLLFPSSRGISFLHFVTSLEFIKRIPFMTAFLKYENRGNGQTNYRASKKTENS